MTGSPLKWHAEEPIAARIAGNFELGHDLAFAVRAARL